MILTQLVTDKETSQRLKELGVKQNSYAYWVKFMHEEVVLQLGLSDGSAPAVGELCEWTASAFTASELLELLPESIWRGEEDNKRLEFLILNKDACYGYWCRYQNINFIKQETAIFGTTAVDSLGYMLIYLIEQGIIKVGEL